MKLDIDQVIALALSHDKATEYPMKLSDALIKIAQLIDTYGDLEFKMLDPVGEDRQVLISVDYDENNRPRAYVAGD